MALFLILLLSVTVALLAGGRVRGIGFGLGVFGALGMLYWMLSGDLGPWGPQMLDFDRWLALGAGGGGLVALAWAITALWPPRRAGAGLTILAVFGALLGGLWAVDTLNRQLDEAEPLQRSMTVLEVMRFNQRRADPHFMIDMRAPDGEVLRLRIPRARAETLARGDVIVLDVYPGALGIRWVPAAE